MSKHTATPWEAKQLLNSEHFVLRWSDYTKPGVYQRRVDLDGDGKFSKENAEFIVTACNAHDDLIAALTSILEKTIDSDSRKCARAALAKAGAA